MYQAEVIPTFAETEAIILKPGFNASTCGFDLKKYSINDKILTISIVPGGQLDGCEQILHFSLSNTNGR